ncbi:hypothetical protein E5288_WYG001418 [Bos mutus]|uniref:Anterior gradient protein 3-like protein n=1 Tax=Bos mutus TaxID=72004 RepID=A0A6B0QZI7_9CETA|nr:hypothetical protein [Bos mutus]
MYTSNPLYDEFFSRHMYEPFGTDVHSFRRLVHELCYQVMGRSPSVPDSTVGPTVDSKSEKLIGNEFSPLYPKGNFTYFRVSSQSITGRADSSQSMYHRNMELRKDLKSECQGGSPVIWVLGFWLRNRSHVHAVHFHFANSLERLISWGCIQNPGSGTLENAVSALEKMICKGQNNTVIPFSGYRCQLGWGDDITWVQTYEEGLFHTQKSNKPLMVIHHLEDCQYCQALKKVFAQNKEIQEMAQNNFIMLNLMHETTDKNLSPDGQYVPRIMFVDPSLTVRADITGRYSNRLYTYEPQDLPLLIENMKKALKLIQSEL